MGSDTYQSKIADPQILGPQTSVLDLRYLKLDQTTPQTIVNGAPIFNAGLVSNDDVAIGLSTALARLHVKGTNSLATIDTTNLLTADGAFDTSTGWTIGAGWTIGSGVATHATGNTATLSGTSTANTILKEYQIIFTVAVTTAGSGFSVSLGGKDAGQVFSTAGTKTIYIHPTATTGTLLFTPGSGGTFVGTIDNVQILEVLPSDPAVIFENSDGILNSIEIRAGGSGVNSLFIGKDAGKFNTNVGGGNRGQFNTFVGVEAGFFNVTGDKNTCLGYRAGYSLTHFDGSATNDSNTLIGYNAGRNITTGYNNNAYGSNAGFNITTGTDNMCFGKNSLIQTTTGSFNTAIGTTAGNSNTTGSSNIFIGYQAGYRQTTTSNLLIFDNQVRANVTIESTNAILYGVMAATPASQTLRMNAEVTTSGDLIVGIADSNKVWFGAGKDASILYDGTNMVINSKEVGTGYLQSTSVIRTSTSLYHRHFHLEPGSFDPGASGATWVAPSANTTGGYQLNAAGEVLYFDIDIDNDWDGASDITVNIYFALNAAGSVSDTVDLRLQCFYNATGDSATKTQVLEVATVTDGTQYKVYKATFTINYDEVSNVVEAGDKIGLILNLETDTSEIDDIVVVHATAHYLTTHIGFEATD